MNYPYSKNHEIFLPIDNKNILKTDLVLLTIPVRSFIG
jgi:hypothetical protein